MNNTKGKVVAIIQARIGSTRLPGKAMLEIEGRPMLWHVIDRIKRSEMIDEVVVATTTEEMDNEIEEFCKQYDVSFYRGSENDVLDRYYKCAKEHGADIVVRITSDCPLIDCKVSDKVIATYLENSVDFVGATNTVVRRFPRGLDTEVVSFDALSDTWHKAKEKHQREHVTIYLYEHPEEYKINNFVSDEDFSGYRWTVDEEDDLEFVREIYKRLYIPGGFFDMEDVVDVLKKDPSLVDINSHVEQKKV